MIDEIISPFQDFLVVKSWYDNNILYQEGWISTNDQDKQREITEPEAFTNVLDSYFARGAPVSSEHNRQAYPIGHVQKGALVRDGKVFKEAQHPTDPADFSNFPGNGTGFYGRIAVNDVKATDQIVKGNVKGSSFIATIKSFEMLPGGVRRFTEFGELIETTIAAYPVNRNAVLSIAKAYGIETPQEEKPQMTPEEIKALIAEAISAALPQKEETAQKAEAPQTVSVEAITESVTKAVDSRLAAFEVAQKAMYDRTPISETKGTIVDPAATRDSDPVAYIIEKANSGAELDETDKHLISELTLHALSSGLQ